MGSFKGPHPIGHLIIPWLHKQYFNGGGTGSEPDASCIHVVNVSLRSLSLSGVACMSLVWATVTHWLQRQNEILSLPTCNNPNKTTQYTVTHWWPCKRETDVLKHLPGKELRLESAAGDIAVRSYTEVSYFFVLQVNHTKRLSFWRCTEHDFVNDLTLYISS
jgi:hypothetical protein